MPRALKTYITNLGFFELAVAAPSMKAALEAWGMSHNAFQHGFAKQTTDEAIIMAATARPGVVLKRPVGSDREFKENADLPRTLPSIRPPKNSPFLKPAAAPKKSKAVTPKEATACRAAIISFEKERKKRQEERDKEEARLQREAAAKKVDIDRAKAALDKAEEAHNRAMEVIDHDRERLKARAQREQDRWANQRRILEESLRAARSR